MNKLLKYYTSVALLLVAALSFTSCYNSCALGFYGKVEEKNSQNTVDSVRNDIYHDGIFYANTFTDSAGHFDLNSKPHSVFMFGECKNTKLEFSKKGYKSLDLAFKKGNNNLVIMLEKN